MAGVSTNTIFVSGRIADARPAASGAATNVVVTPRRLKYRSRRPREGPYSGCVPTRWSPWRSSARNTALTAAIPVAVPTAPHPPSRRATHSSSAAIVGLPRRV